MNKPVMIGVAVLSAIGIFQFLVPAHKAIQLAPASAPAANGSQESVRIRVLGDEPDGRPVSGARIEGHGPGNPIHVRTGDDGRATLPKAGTLKLRILASKFVGVQVPVDLSKPEQVVVLRRTGSVRFTAVDPEGKPVEGLSVGLDVGPVDPSVILPGIEPQKTTGEDGILRWEDLPPGAKIEWRCTSGHPVEPAEGIEVGGSRAVQLDDGRWGLKEGGGSPFQATGSFTVAAGGEHAIILRVRRTSTVRFHLGPGADAGGTAHVEVWSIVEVKTPTGVILDPRIERAIDADVGAAISIPNLTPGRKYLRAAWWDSPRRRSSIRRPFELAEGEAKDLGILPPAHGGTVEFRLSLTGPAEAIERVEKPALAVVVITATAPDSETPTVIDRFEVEFGSPVAVSGVPGTRATVSVTPQFKIREGPGPVEVVPAPGVEVFLPSKGPVELQIKLMIRN